MNFPGYIRHVTIFSWMLTIACCSVVGLGLGLGLDLVSGWLVVMHTYWYYSPLSLSHCLKLHTTDSICLQMTTMNSCCSWRNVISSLVADWKWPGKDTPYRLQPCVRLQTRYEVGSDFSEALYICCHEKIPHITDSCHIFGSGSINKRFKIYRIINL